MYLNTCVCIYIHIYIYTYIYLYVSIYICIYIHIYMYVYTNICIQHNNHLRVPTSFQRHTNGRTGTQRANLCKNSEKSVLSHFI